MKQSSGNRIYYSLPEHSSIGNQYAKKNTSFAEKNTTLILKWKNPSKTEFTMPDQEDHRQVSRRFYVYSCLEFDKSQPRLTVTWHVTAASGLSCRCRASWLPWKISLAWPVFILFAVECAFTMWKSAFVTIPHLPHSSISMCGSCDIYRNCHFFSELLPWV